MIYVSGASGFIGSALSTRLKMNKYEFKTIKIHELQNYRAVPNSTLVHLAANNVIAEVENNFDHERLKAIDTAEKIIQCGFEKIIFSSSAAIYNSNLDKQQTETESKNPKTKYGQLKLELENFFFTNLKNTISLRLSNVYGPGMSTSSVIHSIFNQIKKSNVIRLRTLHEKRDYLYIDDAVDAFISAIQSNEIGAFNISTGIATSVEMIAHMIASFKNNDQINFIIEDSNKKSSLILNSNKARTHLNWSPKTTLNDGLKKAYDHFLMSEDKIC